VFQIKEVTFDNDWEENAAKEEEKHQYCNKEKEIN